MREISTLLAFFIIIIIMVLTFGEDTESYRIKMDNDLKDPFSSFIGEGEDNHSGTVAIAGDVNGDGYDDILIGSSRNGESAEEAGQIYLIFGKASGWPLVLNLSEADASFLGEYRKDWAGRVVAGAGDVNGDGYDDILIGGPRLFSGKAWLIFGKGSGWAMDTNLSTADVRFTSEGHDPRTGSAVACAGDVNNDGYDDMIISAPKDAGRDDKRTGHTYLVLGKASGWSKDMDLSIDADASFLGEDKDDKAGEAIAGAGDVNGDGYDDFIIGAWYNGEGGEITGQTYLILGRMTGWALDTWLSEADASFIGFESDGSGNSVAGAGDVNNDGFDDILIGASREDGATGNTYLILGKASGWSMDTPLSISDASFLGQGGYDFAGSTVAGAGDVNGDGFDDILIGAPGNAEGGGGAGQTYLILGKQTGWTMGVYLGNVDASFIGENQGDSLGRVSGGGDVNSDGLDDILIGAGGNDDGGDLAGKVYLLMFDDEPPVIRQDTTPIMATTGDLFTFNVTASDNLKLTNLTIEYWYADSATHLNSTANMSKGNLIMSTWHLEITVPSDSPDILHYRIHVSDFVDHLTSSVKKNVTIRDNDEPVLTDLTTGRATTGDPFVLRVDAKDNIGIAEIYVDYWFGDTGSHTVVQMDYSPEDVWYHALTIPSDMVDTLHMFFRAKDEADNEATTPTRDLEVVDNDAPLASNDGTPRSVTTGDPFSFSVEASDNIDVSEVSVEYWYGGSELHTSDHMTEGPSGVWTLATTAASDTLDDLSYFFSTVDIAANKAIHPMRAVNVEDNDAPTLTEDTSRPETSTGADYKVSVMIGENIGIERVDLTYRFGSDGPETIGLEGEDLDATGSGFYEHTLTMPRDSVEPLTYLLHITDSSGNELTTEGRSVIVLDTILPVADAGEDMEIDQGDNASLDGSASSDNIGIFEWRWSFEHGNTTIHLEGDMVDFEFADAGVYTVTLFVADKAVNGATDNIELVVYDTELPVPIPQHDIDAVKNEAVVLDGSGSTDNVGVVEWTWTVEYESGKRDIVTGEIVDYEFDEAGDHKVTLTVKDAEGNEATGAAFTVHVPNLLLFSIIIMVAIIFVAVSAFMLKRRKSATEWTRVNADERDR